MVCYDLISKFNVLSVRIPPEDNYDAHIEYREHARYALAKAWRMNNEQSLPEKNSGREKSELGHAVPYPETYPRHSWTSLIRARATATAQHKSPADFISIKRSRVVAYVEEASCQHIAFLLPDEEIDINFFLSRCSVCGR